MSKSCKYCFYESIALLISCIAARSYPKSDGSTPLDTSCAEVSECQELPDDAFAFLHTPTADRHAHRRRQANTEHHEDEYKLRVTGPACLLGINCGQSEGVFLKDRTGRKQRLDRF